MMYVFVLTKITLLQHVFANISTRKDAKVEFLGYVTLNNLLGYVILI